VSLLPKPQIIRFKGIAAAGLGFVTLCRFEKAAQPFQQFGGVAALEYFYYKAAARGKGGFGIEGG